jgi:hypothetical protein
MNIANESVPISGFTPLFYRIVGLSGAPLFKLRKSVLKYITLGSVVVEESIQDGVGDYPVEKCRHPWDNPLG